MKPRRSARVSVSWCAWLGFNVAETPRRSGLRALRSVCSFAAQQILGHCAAGFSRLKGKASNMREKLWKRAFPALWASPEKSPGLFAAALKMFFALCFQGFAKNRDKLSRKKRDKRVPSSCLLCDAAYGIMFVFFRMNNRREFVLKETRCRRPVKC